MTGEGTDCRSLPFMQQQMKYEKGTGLLLPLYTTWDKTSKMKKNKKRVFLLTLYALRNWAFSSSCQKFICRFGALAMDLDPPRLPPLLTLGGPSGPVELPGAESACRDWAVSCCP